MAEFLEKLFAVLGGVAGLVLLIQFVSKEIIKSWLQKDIESFKHNLKSESDRELEVLKAKNNLVLSEFQEKVTHLSKKRSFALLCGKARFLEQKR